MFWKFTLVTSPECPLRVWQYTSGWPRCEGGRDPGCSLNFYVHSSMLWICAMVTAILTLKMIQKASMRNCCCSFDTTRNLFTIHMLPAMGITVTHRVWATKAVSQSRVCTLGSAQSKGSYVIMLCQRLSQFNRKPRTFQMRTLTFLTRGFLLILTYNAICIKP